jgi:subtilisin family serine protease
MKKQHILARAILLILILCFAAPLFAADDGYIVQAPPFVMDWVARLHQLQIVKQVGKDGTYLVKLPNGVSVQAILAALRSVAGVQSVEPNAKVKLPAVSGDAKKGKRRIPFMAGGPPTVPMPGSPFSGYTNQLSNSVIRLQDAQKKFGYGHGGVQVAIIDTGVDFNHAVLAPVLNKADSRDFTKGNGGMGTNQETTPFVDQETTPFVDGIGAVVVVQQETTPFVDQETTPFVDQETTPFVDQETTPFVDGKAYGHGTMVAGLIHLVAPRARILPLRAFRYDGSGTIADVVQAIEYAIDLGNVDVINMSFSAPESSPALNRAMARAAAKGIICVASLANDHSSKPVYPAAISPAIGVAASTNDGYRASFSGFGSEADIAAPGVEIWSTYPSNRVSNQRYASASGTSFSTGYVSGTVALMVSVNRRETAEQADADLTGAAGKLKSPELKAGQLNVYGSVNSAK